VYVGGEEKAGSHIVGEPLSVALSDRGDAVIENTLLLQESGGEGKRKGGTSAISKGPMLGSARRPGAGKKGI